MRKKKFFRHRAVFFPISPESCFIPQNIFQREKEIYMVKRFFSPLVAGCQLIPAMPTRHFFKSQKNFCWVTYLFLTGVFHLFRNRILCSVVSPKITCFSQQMLLKILFNCVATMTQNLETLIPSRTYFFHSSQKTYLRQGVRNSSKQLYQFHQQVCCKGCHLSSTTTQERGWNTFQPRSVHIIYPILQKYLVRSLFRYR